MIRHRRNHEGHKSPSYVLKKTIEMKDLTLLGEPPLWFVFFCIFHLSVSLLSQSLQNSAHALNAPNTRPSAIPVYDNRPLDNIRIATRETDESFGVMGAIRERWSRRV